MERKKVKEFEVSYVKIVNESILYNTRVSLSKFSLEAFFLSFMGIRGIYTG